MSERTGTQAPRRRLSAEEARERILHAAERKLAAVGPEGLRLTELAAELGISHPAILHHFGSREELVAAVVARAFAHSNQRLEQAIAGRAHGYEAMLDMVAEFYGKNGNARLLAWLLLTGRTGGRGGRGARGGGGALQRMIELAHAQRTAACREREIDYEDTKFRAQLTALALLGDAIFGDLIRRSSGDAAGASSAREFRRRLAKLLADTA
jgi:AcrR family transcriptional regulator